MSELKTNKISTNNANNVAIDNALGLKSYDTTARDALTSVAGDMIYNTTTSKVEYYTGSAWTETGGADAVSMQFLLVGGGGGMRNDAQAGGGAGAGEFMEESIYLAPSTNYEISVGGGGSSGGGAGSPSYIGELAAAGGGFGRTRASSRTSP